jgi:hypothetical protein
MYNRAQPVRSSFDFVLLCDGFSRLVDQVMQLEPYPTTRLLDQWTMVHRTTGTVVMSVCKYVWPNIIPVTPRSTPVGSNRVGISFAIIQRKVLAPKRLLIPR